MADDIAADVHDLARAVRIVAVGLQTVMAALSDPDLPHEQREHVLAQIRPMLDDTVEQMTAIEKARE
jgi:hypothetical protein